MTVTAKRKRQFSRAQLSVRPRKGKIVIEIGFGTLATAARHMPQLEVFDEEELEWFTPSVPDPAAFAHAVISALRSEEEDGTTLVHTMFDRAIIEAIEAGAEGIITGDDRRIAARDRRRKRQKADAAP